MPVKPSSTSSNPRLTPHLLRLVVPARTATPTPPLGPALGQRGVKAADFCAHFNQRTAHVLPATPLRVKLRVFPDRSFTYTVHAPTTTWFLKTHLGIAKGASHPGHPDHPHIGEVSVKAIYEIAKIKARDMGVGVGGGGDDGGLMAMGPTKKKEKEVDGEEEERMLRRACRALAASARSVGVRVVP